MSKEIREVKAKHVEFLKHIKKRISKNLTILHAEIDNEIKKNEEK